MSTVEQTSPVQNTASDRTAAPRTDAGALRSGDPRAFDRLYAELAPRVLGYVLRLSGGASSRAEAEDIVQDTFLAAYTGRAGFTGRSQPLAWLLGIAWRRWRDDSRIRRPQTAPLDGPEGGIAEFPAESIARSVVLDRAMARLPDAERDALLLVAVQGLTYREAAQVLDQPAGTVKWRVHEATKRLRILLADWEETR